MTNRIEEWQKWILNVMNAWGQMTDSTDSGQHMSNQDDHWNTSVRVNDRVNYCMITYFNISNISLCM